MEPFFGRTKRGKGAFVFRVDGVASGKDGGVVLTGRILQGGVYKGECLDCLAADRRCFPCTVIGIQRFGPASNPDYAEAGGILQGRCGLRIAGWDPEDFGPGDRLVRPGRE